MHTSAGARGAHQVVRGAILASRLRYIPRGTSFLDLEVGWVGQGAVRLRALGDYAFAHATTLGWRQGGDAFDGFLDGMLVTLTATQSRNVHGQHIIVTIDEVNHRPTRSAETRMRLLCTEDPAVQRQVGVEQVPPNDPARLPIVLVTPGRVPRPEERAAIEAAARSGAHILAVVNDVEQFAPRQRRALEEIAGTQGLRLLHIAANAMERDPEAATILGAVALGQAHFIGRAHHVRRMREAIDLDAMLHLKRPVAA